MAVWNLNSTEYFILSIDANYGDITDWKILITDLSTGISLDETLKCEVIKIQKMINPITIEYSVKINTNLTNTQFSKNSKYQITAYSQISGVECSSDFITFNAIKDNWVMRTIS